MTFEDPKKKNQDEEMNENEGAKGGEASEDTSENQFEDYSSTYESDDTSTEE